ncbi:MAG: ATP synthase F1 subunit epsilon [Bacteroidota bacterium]|nr:ATP synthase F1 subunit epsilon [Candidatus Kapabacteria bacterium]MCS7303448.1 ATP synthase F1 subunit epsilon [Candidatus Kapabacteria bacterium]MCX7937776.1 ATP synthase F1 subunit epsilon [Chlorobiota bacterium]MDW8075060.1 ATP synthase F1 subunit epsilon [Bacteroidota bacterium]MDW8272046.1 ATP synthase F1 subunit epsilon [Bacteroidota bacterium]
MAATHLQIEIVTPQGTIYSGSAQAVSLPGGLAPFQVLVNHAPIISTLELGALVVLDSDGIEHVFAVTGGFVEVKHNHVSVVAEEIYRAEEIDADRARAERDRLDALLEQETDLHRRNQLKAARARADLLVRIAAASATAE